MSTQLLPIASIQIGRQTRRPSFRRYGFTLIELLVSIAIIGILIGMLLPATQAIRESARQTACQNKLKNHSLALLGYESAKHAFPHGAIFETKHSWGLETLPWLEQSQLYDRFDPMTAWDSPTQNLAAASLSLPIFSCPSSHKRYPGKTDYCGISGSWWTDVTVPRYQHNGILFPSVTPESQPIKIQSITDGTSNTIIVAEGAEVLEINDGYWANGFNCFSHEEGGVNTSDRPSDEIVSDHVNGANATMCDGSVRFIHSEISGEIVAALCTRNARELISVD